MRARCPDCALVCTIVLHKLDDLWCWRWPIHAAFQARCDRSERLYEPDL